MDLDNPTALSEMNGSTRNAYRALHSTRGSKLLSRAGNVMLAMLALRTQISCSLHLTQRAMR